jgi:hypothetical protein
MQPVHRQKALEISFPKAAAAPASVSTHCQRISNAGRQLGLPAEARDPNYDPLQSQTDGLWRFAAPSSFFRAAEARARRQSVRPE